MLENFYGQKFPRRLRLYTHGEDQRLSIIKIWVFFGLYYVLFSIYNCFWCDKQILLFFIYFRIIVGSLFIYLFIFLYIYMYVYIQYVCMYVYTNEWKYKKFFIFPLSSLQFFIFRLYTSQVLCLQCTLIRLCSSILHHSRWSFYVPIDRYITRLSSIHSAYTKPYRAAFLC